MKKLLSILCCFLIPFTTAFATETNKENIVELFRLACLGEENGDILLTTLIQQAIATTGKDAPVKDVVSAVKERMDEEGYFDCIIAIFEEVFSEEEILTLLTAFRSEAMQKFQKNSMKFALPALAQIAETIGEVLEPYPAIVVEEDFVVAVNESNFKKEVLESDLPVVLDLYASWCGPCQKLAPVFAELSRELHGLVKFAKVNVDESPELVKRLNVKMMPTLLFYKEGKVVGRHVGFLDKMALLEKIARMLQ